MSCKPRGRAKNEDEKHFILKDDVNSSLQI